MEPFSPKNIVSRLKMSDLPEVNIVEKTTIVTIVEPAVGDPSPAKEPQAKEPRAPSRPGSRANSRGSPKRAPKTAKTEPPALSLSDATSQATGGTGGTQDPLVLGDEPLLTPNPRRFVLFPVEHPDVLAMAKKAISVFWVPEEIDLSKDMKDWEKLDDNTRKFVSEILGFFAASDGILMENLALNFQHEVQWPEAKYFYANQNFMEGVHSETYSLLIETYIQDKAEKQRLFEAAQRIPAVQKKADWAMQWLDSKSADFATRLLAFAVVEGIFFSGAFCAIFWLKKRGLMPGLTTSNEFIARDEGLHTDFACLLYGKIKHRLTKARAHKMIKEAVKIEKNFITKALPCELIGMNATLMSQYIEFVADRLLSQLGYPKAFNVANPFDFMERISLEGKDNFFEKRVTNYAKQNVGKNQEEMSFSKDADF